MAREYWKSNYAVFCEAYAPAIIGGIFLCLADLIQNDRQGQIMKVGGTIKRVFLPQTTLEAYIGLAIVLLLSVALCWVFRPANRGEAFAKGASVFAILAALVPAKEPPGASLERPVAPSAARSPQAAGGFVGRAHAQAVIPTYPVGKARVTIRSPSRAVADRIAEEGLSVWLIDPSSGEALAYERIKESRFSISKAPKEYVLEVELPGYRRLRTAIVLREIPAAYDLDIGNRYLLPLGVQRLLPPATPALSYNETESLKLQGAEASRRGDYAGAIALYDRALAKSPDDKETLNYKGYALFKLQRYEEASRLLDAALRIDPSYFLARLNFAKSSCRAAREPDAAKVMLGTPPLSAAQVEAALSDGEFAAICPNVAARMGVSRPRGRL